MPRKKNDLKSDLKTTNNELAKLNRELATQMVKLADQTGEVSPLIDAVRALRSVQQLYSLDSTPHENAEVQKALADTLLKLGRRDNNNEAIEHAIEAYRGAITIASLVGDNDMRQELKRNYGFAKALLGKGVDTQSLFKVA